MKKPLFLETLLLFSSVILLDGLARFYHLYWLIYEFDSVVHFVAGAALALFFSWLYFFSGFFQPLKRSLLKFASVSLLGAIFIGVSWEIYELIFRQTMVQKVDYSYDLTMDLIMDLLGTIAGTFYAYWRELKLQKLVPMIYNGKS